MLVSQKPCKIRAISANFFTLRVYEKTSLSTIERNFNSTKIRTHMWVWVRSVLGKLVLP